MKKKLTKKILTMLLCIAVLFTLSFSSAFADAASNAYQTIDRATVYDAEKIENELIQSELDSGKIKISSLRVTYKTGKPAVEIKFNVDCGVELDGIEVYRSFKKDSGYEKIFTTKNSSYLNTKVKKNTRYYYKARGFVIKDGVKYTTPWSNKANRIVKTNNVKYRMPAKLYIGSMAEHKAAPEKQPAVTPSHSSGHWYPSTTYYTVTFDMQGHGSNKQTTVASGGKISNPPQPTVAGYTFGEWYKEATCENAWDFSNDTVKSNTILYAKWEAKTTAIPTVVVDDKGEIKVGDEKVEITVSNTTQEAPLSKKQTTELADTINDMLKSEAIATETNLATATNINNTEGLNAIIEALKNKTNDNIAKDNIDAKKQSDIDLQVKVELSNINVDKAGDTLTITYMEFDVTPIATVTVQNREGQTVSISTEIANQQLTENVKFRLPIDKNTIDTTVAVYHEEEFLGNYPVMTSEGNKYIEVESQYFSKYGYQLLNENNAGAKIGDKLYFKFTDAVAKVENEETITLLKSAEPAKDIEINKVITFSVDKKDKEYTDRIKAADGYKLSSETNGTVITYSISVTPAPTYTVTFDLNGITGTAPASQSIASGSKATKPTDPTFANHTFAGWYKTKDATTGALSDLWDFDNGTVTANMTLYAQWERTMESILSTNPGIPKVENLTPPSNAWANSTSPDCKAFVGIDEEGDTLFVVKKEGQGVQPFGLLMDDTFVRINENTYKYNDVDATVIANMKDGKFTSCEWKFNPSNYQFLIGTYKAPTPVSITSVSLNKAELELQVGGTETLTATVLPDNATNKNVTWSSSKESVATVSDGTVLAIAAGEAIITVTTADGGKTATCTVTVTPAPATTYTVEFNMQGHGTQIASYTDIASGLTIKAPTAPTATGFDFEGWYKEDTFTNKWDFDKDTVKANTILYARWTNYLCFTAEEDGSSISMKKTGSLNLGFEYSQDKKDWTQFDLDSPATISLASPGDKVYFRGTNTNGFNSNNSKYVCFTMEGKIAASGSVMSLVDGAGLSTEIPGNSYFYGLFDNCSSLTTAPELPATSLKQYCYMNMFRGCASLSAAPELPATTLTAGCYSGMFSDCSNLAKAPELPAKELANSCYYQMFQKCTSLSSAPELPASTLAQSCYSAMFYGCTSLKKAPELPATTLALKCYDNMFNGCASLSSAPKLPATTLAQQCYNQMFFECASLESAPNLPATKLEQQCYENMFKGCTSLASAPEKLPAATLAQKCYSGMFSDCSNLTKAPELPAEELADSCYIQMFKNCAKLSAAPGLPATNLAQQCYEDMFNGCSNLVTAPEKLTATTLAQKCYSRMFSGCSSLTKAPELPAEKLADSCYNEMFKGCTSLASAPEKLPAATLAQDCYSGMFNGCSSLTKAPELPATNLALQCYNQMFSGCTSLASAPNLPATNLAQQCYKDMFNGCSSLVTAPELPAMTLAQKCYSGMFSGCSSLTKAPELPATTLAQDCYSSMFSGCTSLETAPVLHAMTLADGCYHSMFSGCSSLSSAPELPATTLAQQCYNQMFNGCTSLASASNLPATTLAQACYSEMFSGCTSLTKAPALPAEELADSCYKQMFYNCTSLSEVTMLATITSADSFVNWLDGVAPSGTVYVSAKASFKKADIYLPSGWNINNRT